MEEIKDSAFVADTKQTNTTMKNHMYERIDGLNMELLSLNRRVSSLKMSFHAPLLFSG